MPTNFRYVPTSGNLSGSAFEAQTEQALNELGTEIDSIAIKSVSATDTANQALTAAQQAEAAASNAEALADAAEQAANRALAETRNLNPSIQTAQSRADAAYDLAATAEDAATTAQSTADAAQNAANGAVAGAEEAAGLARQAQLQAQEALGMASGLYTVMQEPVAIDEITGAERLYLVHAANPGLPVSAPAYLDVTANDDGTSVTQKAWNETETRYRVGAVARIPNAATDSFTFSAAPADGSASTTGALEVTSGGQGTILAAACSPGSFSHDTATERTLNGVVAFPLEDFTDGTVSINGTEAVLLSGGEAALSAAVIQGEQGALTIKDAAYASGQLELTLSYTWENTTDTAAWGNWQAFGGGNGTDGLPLFAVIPFPLNTTQPGYLSVCVDNGILTADSFPQAAAQLAAMKAAGEANIVSLDAYAADMAAQGGICGRFALSDDGTQFRIPCAPGAYWRGLSAAGGLSVGDWQKDAMRSFNLSNTGRTTPGATTNEVYSGLVG